VTQVAPRFYTVGHSTRSAEDFLVLLNAHGIAQLADVRTIPRSRRHPHFSREALATQLQEHGIEYRHYPGLGGLRRPRADSPNTAWKNASFRGYADHMMTPEFAVSFDELLTFGRAAPTAIMCAEAVWWRCHRALLSDALMIRGVDVLHIDSKGPPRLHRVNEFARNVAGNVTYPGLV
jgi:uncharacterized protein (DUF488 family)